jgi:hypothetical protein
LIAKPMPTAAAATAVAASAPFFMAPPNAIIDDWPLPMSSSSFDMFVAGTLRGVAHLVEIVVQFGHRTRGDLGTVVGPVQLRRQFADVALGVRAGRAVQILQLRLKFRDLLSRVLEFLGEVVLGSEPDLHLVSGHPTPPSPSAEPQPPQRPNGSRTRRGRRPEQSPDPC